MIIQLTKNKVAIIDSEDFKLLSKYKWHYSNGYAKVSLYLGGGRKNQKRKGLWMHKLVMDAPDDKEVDHINGNKLDNRKTNLKVCTHAENMRNYPIPKNNTSGYKYVTYHKQSKKWQARAWVNGIKKSLGMYESAKEAARAIAMIK